MGASIYVSLRQGVGIATAALFIDRLKSAVPDITVRSTPAGFASQNWQREIVNAVDASDLMIVVAPGDWPGVAPRGGPQSAHEVLAWELGCARSNEMPVVVVVLDDALWPPPDAFDDRLGLLRRARVVWFSPARAQDDVKDVLWLLGHAPVRLRSLLRGLSSEDVDRLRAEMDPRQLSKSVAIEDDASEVAPALPGELADEDDHRRSFDDAEYQRRLETEQGNVPPTIGAAQAREEDALRTAAARAEAERNAEYARRLHSEQGNVPPTIGAGVAGDQDKRRYQDAVVGTERNAEYLRRMQSDQGDVPPTLASAPVLTGGAAPSWGTTQHSDSESVSPVNAALSTREMANARVADGERTQPGRQPPATFDGDFEDTADTDFAEIAEVVIRKPAGAVSAAPAAAARAPSPRPSLRPRQPMAPPSPPPAPLPQAAPDFGTWHSAPRGGDIAGEAHRPPARPMAYPSSPEPTRQSRVPRLAAFGTLLALIAVLPFLSRTFRDNFSQSIASLLAYLNVKQNAFSFLALFRRKTAEPNRLQAVGPADDVPPITDQVDCSVFAPAQAAPETAIMVQVFLHIPQHAARAAFQAGLIDETASGRGVKSLETPIARGSRVDIALEVADAALLDEPVQSIIWRGEPAFVQFILKTPAKSGCNLFPKVRISVAGGLVGCISFRIGVTSTAGVEQSVPRGDSARRYSHAFLSYASADRKEVLKRAQVLKAAGVSFFQDILSLDPGDRWEREIYRHIDKCDLFLLFWSKSARDSEYVLKEAMYALERQRNSDGEMPDIVPVIVDGPPAILPPEALASLHFNDKISYLIAAS